MGELPADFRSPHLPYKLETTKQYEKLRKEIIGGIRDGLPVKDAFMAAGIPQWQYYDWRRWFEEDVVDGFTGTNLIKLFFEVMKEDKKLYRRLSRKMMEKVDEGDTRMMMYMADNRFGNANKRKNTLEVGSKNDGNVNINIVNMTSVDALEEGEEVEEIEVNGECRDDTDPTEMD